MIDPFTEDPIDHPLHPAITSDVHFESHGQMLNGVMMLTTGAGPHPLVLLLHGFPGNERNFDLAQIYRRAGLSTLVFHYRGAWGSQGAFSFQHSLEDAAAALEFCQTNATKYRLDPNRIALVGHSMGGWIALHQAARNQSDQQPSKAKIKALISICGFNFGRFSREVLNNPANIQKWTSILEDEVRPLRGTSGQALIDEMLAQQNNWDLTTLAPALQTTPTMLIGATHDTTATPELAHQPLADALSSTGVPLEQRIYPSDHSLANHRVQLARDTLGFLRKHL